MFSVFLVWVIFCAIIIPMFILITDQAAEKKIAVLEEKVFHDDIDPRDQMSLYNLKINRDETVTTLWVISGFGTIYGFLFAMIRSARCGGLKSERAVFWQHLEEVYTAHYEDKNCNLRSYCEYCSGEWLPDLEAGLVDQNQAGSTEEVDYGPGI